MDNLNEKVAGLLRRQPLRFNPEYFS